MLPGAGPSLLQPQKPGGSSGEKKKALGSLWSHVPSFLSFLLKEKSGLIAAAAAARPGRRKQCWC